MDSQSIGPVSGQAAPAPAPAPVPANARAQAGTVGTASDVAHAKPVKAVEPEKPKVEVDVRVRDPRSLQYQVDGGTKQVVATIVDDDNRLVIRQIPDAEVLRIAQAIDRMKGFLLEGKA